MRHRAKWSLIGVIFGVFGSAVACGDESDELPSEAGGRAGSAGSSQGGSEAQGGEAGGGSSGESGQGGQTDQGGAGGTGGGGTGLGGAGKGGGAGTSGAGKGGKGGQPSASCDLSRRPDRRTALPADITSDTVLDNANDYYISGLVRVHEGATLTIPPCTRLEGSPPPNPGVLAVLRGARLVANGAPDEPILFTGSSPSTRYAESWGGVLLLGRAPIAIPSGASEVVYAGLVDELYTYGGSDPGDDSGSLSYVRIEFNGHWTNQPREISGLSMAGVGSATTIHHVMVSNSHTDCFGWWGGTVSADHLVCNNPGDDYFDAAEGWQGSGEYWFGRRAHLALVPPDSSRTIVDPNGIELDAVDRTALPRTQFSLSKVTLCGTAQSSMVPPARSFGLLFRGGVTGSIDQLAMTGFDHAIDTSLNYAAGDVTVEDSTFWNFIYALDNNENESGLSDNDGGYIDGAVIAGESSNVTVPATRPFHEEDCIALQGPTPDVFASGIGAFVDGSEWMEGAWINWAEE